MSVEIKLDTAALAQISRAAREAALEAVVALQTEVKSAQVIPFNNSNLQGSMNVSQVTVGDEIYTALNTDQPYARFIYYGHLMLADNGSSWAKPGEKKHVVEKTLNFQTGNNPNAQGEWLKLWLPGGDREGFLSDTFAEKMKERMPK